MCGPICEIQKKEKKWEKEIKRNKKIYLLLLLK